MPKVIATAPGKVTLFGEHAVVYGYPAIVTSIDRRVYVRASPRDDNVINISAYDLKTHGIVVTYRGSEVYVTTDYGKSLSAVSYLNRAVNITADYLGIRRGVNLDVKSEMPVGAGLGTSAAVSVAAIAAYAGAHGYTLGRDEISELGWRVEREVQGLASPMDTSIATYGGFLKLSGEGGEFRKESLSVNAELPAIIAYVERSKSTKEMVLKVRELLSRHEELVKGIFRLIGRVTEEAEVALKGGDLRTLGELMNINQGLLDALGVSDARLNELVHLARFAGALGSKLTGAGGGGAVIALAPGKLSEVETALRLRASIILRAKFGSEGVKVRVID